MASSFPLVSSLRLRSSTDHFRRHSLRPPHSPSSLHFRSCVPSLRRRCSSPFCSSSYNPLLALGFTNRNTPPMAMNSETTEGGEEEESTVSNNLGLGHELAADVSQMLGIVDERLDLHLKDKEEFDSSFAYDFPGKESSTVEESVEQITIKSHSAVHTGSVVRSTTTTIKTVEKDVSPKENGEKETID